MIDFSKIKKLTVDGVDLKSLEINGILVWKSGYKNWVKYSIDADGTIYNNGKGYKDGYRIRSGGAEAVQSGAACTGFIPVNGGSVVRISGAAFNNTNSQNAINVADSSFTNIGQAAKNANYGIFTGDYKAYGNESIVEESDGVWKWIVPPSGSGVAYIRVTGQTGDGSTLIITVDEEIT